MVRMGSKLTDGSNLKVDASKKESHICVVFPLKRGSEEEICTHRSVLLDFTSLNVSNSPRDNRYLLVIPVVRDILSLEDELSVLSLVASVDAEGLEELCSRGLDDGSEGSSAKEKRQEDSA